MNTMPVKYAAYPIWMVSRPMTFELLCRSPHFPVVRRLCRFFKGAAAETVVHELFRRGRKHADV